MDSITDSLCYLKLLNRDWRFSRTTFLAEGLINCSFDVYNNNEYSKTSREGSTGWLCDGV